MAGRRTSGSWIPSVPPLVRVTAAPVWHGFPVWSPDNSELIYASVEGDVLQRALYRQDLNSVRKATRILAPQSVTSPYDWSRDGRLLIYGVMADGGGHFDLWILPLGGSQPPYSFLESDHNARFAQFSPDSQFVAFSWAQSGRDEVYVQSVDRQNSRRWQISTSGGTQPRWSNDGKQIYFLGADGKVMTAPVKVKGAELEPGAIVALFPYPQLAVTSSAYQYDVSPNGNRFVFLRASAWSVGPPLRMVVNWEGLLKR